MSNDLPLFSVIMPCHRQHDYLHGAISSVLAQTESRWELLLVDDSPRQDLIMAQEDPRIRRLASGGSRGVSEARNRALQAARGRWAAFLDSDDLWDPSKLAVFVEVFKSSGLKALCSDSFYMDETGHVSEQKKQSSLHPNLYASNRVDLESILTNNYIITSSVVADVALIRDLGGFDSRLTIAEDAVLWIRLVHAHGMGIVHRPLTVYRSPLVRSLRYLNDYKKMNFLRIEILTDLYSPRLARKAKAFIHYNLVMAHFRNDHFLAAINEALRSLLQHPAVIGSVLWQKVQRCTLTCHDSIRIRPPRR